MHILSLVPRGVIMLGVEIVDASDDLPVRASTSTVVVIGAAGFIGGSVAARLRSDGYRVVSVVRRAPSYISTRDPVVVLDVGRSSPSEWDGVVSGADAVVNCVGLLQDGPSDDLAAAHSTGPDRLFAACERVGVRRVVHLSAVGVDREQVSSFSASKHVGDQSLKRRDLDWVILRPAVVLGRGAVGASALIRGLAGLPLLPVMPGTAPLQVVRLEDVAATVAAMIRPDAPKRVELELVGPHRLSFEDVVAAYRRWLGWPPARTITLPTFAAGVLYRAGDLVGRLGWRSPLRSNASLEIARGAVGSVTACTEATGIVPQSLHAALAAEPAGVQDRWHAALYFLRPLTIAVLAGFWIATGVISLTVGFDIGVDLMRRTAAAPFAEAGVMLGAIADLLIGTAIAVRRTARVGLWAAMALSAAYIVLGTILLPELWREPLGPLMKIWPILVLHFVAIAVLGGRR
jgi:uncharacterized protein YbjT (DUF2867 family)